MPGGFQNGTDGTIKVAIDAINAAGAPHCFLSVTKWGHSAIVNTSGNGDCHIILRGGKEPNYSAKHVAEVKAGLEKAGLAPQVMIDFSHANSSKQFKKQMEVGADVCQQIASGERAVIGVMIESHLVEGNQNLEGSEPLVYGKSVTDACIGWDDTDAILRQLADAVKAPSRLSMSRVIKKRRFSTLFYIRQILLRFTLVRHGCRFCSDFVGVTQVVMFNWLEVFVELVHQRHAGRDVQLEDFIFTHVVRYFTSARRSSVSSDNDALAAFRRGGMVSFQ